MRRAMAEAEVGDDVYGEDPTVNRLEQRAAEITGKEAALFVPTGTMGNTIGVKVHTQHGQEVICEARAHVLNYELSMMAWFSGCVARPILADDGILRWEQIQQRDPPARSALRAHRLDRDREHAQYGAAARSTRWIRFARSATEPTSWDSRFTWTARAFSTPRKHWAFGFARSWRPWIR